MDAMGSAMYFGLEVNILDALPQQSLISLNNREFIVSTEDLVAVKEEKTTQVAE